jgi:hypothetical protein
MVRSPRRYERQLSGVIASSKGSAPARQRLYELQSKHYEEELALVEYCEKRMAGASQSYLEAHPMCAEIAYRAAHAKEANVAALAALRERLGVDAVQ